MTPIIRLATALLTENEVAQQLSVKPQTLAKWRCTRRHPLPYIKIGNLVRYAPSHVEDFIRRGRETPGLPHAG